MAADVFVVPTGAGYGVTPSRLPRLWPSVCRTAAARPSVDEDLTVLVVLELASSSLELSKAESAAHSCGET